MQMQMSEARMKGSNQYMEIEEGRNVWDEREGWDKVRRILFQTIRKKNLLLKFATVWDENTDLNTDQTKLNRRFFKGWVLMD